MLWKDTFLYFGKPFSQQTCKYIVWSSNNYTLSSLCILFKIRGQRIIVLSGFKMNPLTNAFRYKDIVKRFFLLGEFNILLEEKPCPWSPRWQIMGLILFVSQMCVPHKCTAPLFFSRITLESSSGSVTSNFSTGINHLWIRPLEDKRKSIWIYFFAYLPPLTQYEEKETWHMMAETP